MGNRRTLFTAWSVALSVMVLAVNLAGCAALPPNSFIDPTKVGRFGWDGDAKEGGIRRVLSPRETPPGLAGATEPTPDDLVVNFSDYRIGPGDVLNLAIPDLLETGVPYNVAIEVNPLGEIRIPDLGTVKIAGLTEQELEQELKARLKEAGLLPRPLVIAFVQQKRGRTFNIVGAIRAPGVYPIAYPDTRLLEAITMAGDADASARKAYVIRREGGYAEPEPAPAPPAAEGWVIPPPDEGQPASFSSAGGSNYGEPPPATTQPPPTRAELEDVLKPTPAESRPTTGRSAPGTQAEFQPLVFDPQTGEVKPVERSAPAEPPPARPGPPAGPAPERFEQPFEWDDVAEPGLEQRVIAINVTELKAGDPRYNIVVRDRDVINVPIDTGVFYVMGDVSRPGVYAFGGREITVKQALAVCGGFSPMAWPQRCELIRREPGTDKQTTRLINMDAIFAGLEEDFYMRDDDILNVGTHFVAPFLFVIRNSFRFTYGFGFVYDRNFADKDAYGGRLNPEVARQQQRAQRGLPF